MYVLLSSAYRPRYREDILRCLAAPIGATIQFRYDLKWVHQEIKDDTGNVSGEGLVCFVDNDATGTLPIIPVRLVSISDVQRHGSTLSLTFTVGDFAFATANDFARQLASHAENLSPHKDETGSISGYYFFEIGTPMTNLTRANDLATWEQIVNLLSQYPKFGTEEFFWAIIGVTKKGDETSFDRFLRLPAELDANSVYDVAMYHYSPKDMRSETRYCLSLRSGGALKAVADESVVVDSRYDLKHFLVRTESPLWSSDIGWLVIGVPGNWAVDLNLKVKAAWVKSLGLVAVGGVLLAASNVIPMLREAPIPWAEIGGSVVAALFAAAALRFGLGR
jgi:hypothetical protein